MKDNRNNVVKTRLTDHELASLKIKATTLGCSISSALRAGIDCNLEHSPLPPEYWKFLDAIYKHCADLARLGNLLNQLLRIIETTNDNTQDVLRYFNLNDRDALCNLAYDIKLIKERLYEVKFPS